MALEEARRTMQAALEQLDFPLPREDVSILLKQHSNVQEAIKIGLAREDSLMDERYTRYQILLHEEISQQEKLWKYNHICTEAGEESHRKIQDQIRRIVSNYVLPKVFAPLMSTVRRIYAVGGLSECGKSTFASHIASYHGSSCQRLKIGHFLDAASSRLGKDVYTCSERDQAFALCRELHAYSQAHYWLQYLTIESVHRFESIRWLKQILGQTLQIVYIDAALDVRKERSRDALETLAAKDRAKEARGAGRVKEIADLVVDNDGTFEETVSKLKDYIGVQA